MATREEIRWGIINLLVGVAQQKVNGFEAADQILKYLHSQGVVIKVEGELPPLLSRDIYDKSEIEIAIKQAGRMLDAGYTLTEPLIEEA